MQATLSELAALAGARFEGDGDCLLSRVNTLTDANTGEIAFLSNERYRDDLSTTSASAVILKPELAGQCPVKNRLLTDNPYLAYARIAQHLAPAPDIMPAGVHPSAVVEDAAGLPASAGIGPLAVVGANVQLGERVSIGPGCVVGAGCVIGDDTVLSANVVLYPGVQLGRRCLLQAGAVIGGDGFGFANDDGNWVKIPQTGSVQIGDDVEIGVNTAVDRGALHNTHIGNGVKLDNLIQVAHNVSLGDHTAIAGCTAIAGSTSLGRGCTVGGCSGIVGHLNIADNVHISAMTIVTRSLDKPGQYTGGVPAMPHRDWARNMARLRQLDELANRVKSLEQQLATLQGDQREE